MPESARTQQVLAPLSGVIVPIEAVPDPVFSRKMVGDGAAVDPISDEVVAPVDGTVTQLHAAHHAIVVNTEDGLEVLVHVGLDSVLLAGRGFTPLVEVGARVSAGQPLLRLDLEAIAAGARSLLTEVVVTNLDRVERITAAAGLAEAGKTVLLRVDVKAADARPSVPADGPPAESEPVTIPNASGLHARPAATVSDEAKKFASTVRLVRGTEEANAKSVVAIMGLSVRRGDELRVRAVGPDAPQAVERLAALLAAGAGEDPDQPSVAEDGDEPRAATATAVLRDVRSGRREFSGVPASPGLVMGTVFQHRHVDYAVPETGGTREEERAKLRAAVQEAARQLDTLRTYTAEPSRGAIMGVQLAVLDDPDLLEPAHRLIDEGKSAAYGWREAFTRHADHLTALPSALMRERAADLRDVGGRVLALLVGVPQARLEVPEGSVLVAEELTPSEVAGFDTRHVVGICTTTGGSTSHVAILARAMGLPAVCGLDDGVLTIPNGTRVVVDGGRGSVQVSPDEAQVRAVTRRISDAAVQREAEQAGAHLPGRTRDGHLVEVAANIRSVEDAQAAVEAGAEGVGLLRSEFLFMGRGEPPSEEEQAAAYRAVAETLGRNRRFLVRTLDVGGDKPLPYLQLPKEENPFLGLRGVRISLEHPDLFRAQLRAILRAAPYGDVHVMFPMVSTLDELRAAKEILAEEQGRVSHSVKVGIMVEVPSAAAMAELLAPEVDFFSIGTNDLTQYVLAMDRSHPRLAARADALQPAVLRMMAMAIEGAHEHGKWVGVCGELASDPRVAPLLVGLGVDELSVSVPAIASVKHNLSQWSMQECSLLASDALRLRTVAEIRALIGEFHEDADDTPALQVQPCIQ